MKKREVIELHHGFFEDFDFKFHSAHLLFQKTFPQGQQVVFVHYTENPGLSYLEYSFGVRIDEVEEIIHRFLPTLKGYSERSITLIQTPDGISDKMPHRFVIESDSQLADVMELAERFFLSEGFPWMDEMIQPRKLENAFASQKHEGFKTHNFVYNSFRGATLAKLYNEADYPVLRNVYLQQIKQREMTPFTIASFLRLLNYLDHLEA
ncbi:hypothetical protein J0A68_08185 [Algoriphagus sp. H41]|uniref:Uncharacterized protein n=1 Tax=Algoriphagus oliviformis TaxID=2811231 RepID=A0ABS3C2U3_9BACT|nr:hypothetical protein [Algoriphagus oliviformis]MBN7810929.1 hypothetical protein [Algoriphagus oliviformis]